ncbi:MAG: hypothetical protein HY361_03545 [Candidatus Aenigmarchaeota archaeon]|nr:hypothetical protein [Candidatus Aenigmarchaeota archaeon]
MRGKFIVIYGINNIGKTTQAKNLVQYFLNKGLKADYVKYPIYDIKPSGQFLDSVLRSGKQEISEEELQMWFTVNRLQFQSLLKKKLNHEINIIAEDYIGTGLSWGSAKGADYNWLKAINANLIKEDIGILIDGERFVFAREDRHIHEIDEKLMEKVRKRFIEIGREFGWHMVNANQGKEKVSSDIITVLRENRIFEF